MKSSRFQRRTRKNWLARSRSTDCLKPPPADEEAELGVEVLHGPDELIEDDALDRGVGAFDLDTDSWLSEAQGAGRGEKIDSVVGAGWRLVDNVTFGFEDGSDEVSEAMAFELGQDQAGDLIVGRFFEVDG